MSSPFVQDGEGRLKIARPYFLNKDDLRFFETHLNNMQRSLKALYEKNEILEKHNELLEARNKRLNELLIDRQDEDVASDMMEYEAYEQEEYDEDEGPNKGSTINPSTAENDPALPETPETATVSSATTTPTPTNVKTEPHLPRRRNQPIVTSGPTHTILEETWLITTKPTFEHCCDIANQIGWNRKEVEEWFETHRNASLQKRKHAHAILDEFFKATTYPSRDEKLELARACAWSVSQVNAWLSRKRFRAKDDRSFAAKNAAAVEAEKEAAKQATLDTAMDID